MQTNTLAPAAALPAGYTARPAQLSDAPAVVAMLNACSQALLGADQHILAETEKWWQSPNLNLETDSLLVLAPDGPPAGFVLIEDIAPHVQPEQWGRVHPAHTGRGLGTYLLAWSEARVQQSIPLAPAGARVIVTDWLNSLDSAAQALVTDFGHTLVRTAWRMVIDLDDAIPPPAPVWPEGTRGRTFVLGQDDEAVVRTNRASFEDHWGHVEQPFEEDLAGWRHNWATSPSFDASLWSLAVATSSQGEHIVGTSFARAQMPEDPNMGWIFALGVRREWRRRGLALALLHDSFNRLYARGLRRVGLGVDATSLTGATRLYEKAGMRSDPKYTYQVWEKELRPGTNLVTTALEAH